MSELLVETQLFKCSPIQLLEGIKSPAGNPMVQGILTTAELKNGNGRYYSRQLWEDEMAKYDDFIKKNNSLGELDHSCFVEGYKILTKEKGWIEFQNLSGEESVATVNPENSKLEFQKIEKVINSPYNGDIINIESKTFQANVTPNHRFLITNQHDYQNGKIPNFKLASELNSKSGFLIPKISTYLLGNNENIIIENEFGRLEISANIFATFMGWWLAEGSVCKSNNGYNISIPQSRDSIHLDGISNNLEALGKEIGQKISKYHKGKNDFIYSFNNKILNNYLRQFGICDEKYIPKNIKNMSKDNIQLFLDAYLSADGSVQKNQEVYYTTSPQMALDISELVNLTGYMSSTSTKKMAYEKYLVEGKWIKDFDWYVYPEKYANCIIENRKKHYTGRTLYSIRRKYSKHYHINDCEITTSHYIGNIYCVSVPNKTILVMSPNGSTFWSGNSEQVVNLKNVSHIIREYWWDGDHVIGKIEILPTPSGNILKALIENNVTVGISSRGVGELGEEQNGIQEVTSYNLICFDMVSNPSNPGSYMKRINESKQLTNNNNKINDIIREILCSKGSCPVF